MELLRSEQLRSLLEDAAGPCVSIFLPTHRRGVQTKQGAIRLKNLLKDAEKQLSAHNLRAAETRELLDQAQKLCENTGFWQYQSDGLALFSSREKFLYFRLPLQFEELLVVTDRFHVKPLMRMFTEDGRFYLLTLSKNDVRFFQCTRYGVRETPLPAGTPKSLGELSQLAGIERQLQVHSAGVSTKLHGHGARTQDSKQELLEFFRLIDKGVREVVRDDRAPLVLAGVEYLFPVYREANAHPQLISAGVPGNPEGRRPEDLQADAWRVVEPHLLKTRREAASRFEEYADTARASNDPEEVVPAACQGRVEQLFAAVGRQQWGSFNSETQKVSISSEHQLGDQDLLDLAAIQAFLHGGAVYAVDPSEVPGGGTLAAVFRY